MWERVKKGLWFLKRIMVPHFLLKQKFDVAMHNNNTPCTRVFHATLHLLYVNGGRSVYVCVCVRMCGEGGVFGLRTRGWR